MQRVRINARKTGSWRKLLLPNTVESPLTGRVPRRALDVVRSKSVASMPLLLSVASFACSSTWGAYAAVVSVRGSMVRHIKHEAMSSGA